MERTDDLEYMLIANKSIKNIIKLFRTRARSTEKWTSFANSNECCLKLLQNAFEVINYFLNLLWPSSYSFSHCVIHLSNDSGIILFLLLTYFFIFRQFLLNTVKKFLCGSILVRAGKPMVLALNLHLNSEFIVYNNRNQVIYIAAYKNWIFYIRSICQISLLLRKYWII